MKEIQARIGPNGDITIEYAGFQGKACLKEGEQLRRLLQASGVTVEETRFEGKPELEFETVEGETMASSEQTVSQRED